MRLSPLQFGLLAALALLGGCATGSVRKHHTPAEAPAAFVAQPAGVVDAESDAGWWRVFQDPALEGLITRALSANLDAGIAVARLEEARALARVARSGHLPGGGVEAAFEHRRLPGSERAPNGSRDVESARFGANVSWELDLFGRVRHSVAAARADVGGAQALLRSVRATVAADTASHYFELRSAEAALQVAHSSVETQQRALDMTRRRTQAGGGARMDVLRAEAQLHAVQATIPGIQADAARARHALAVLVGEAPERFATPAPAKGGLPRITQLPIGTPAALLRRRPDISAAEHALAASSSRAAAARAELFPQVNITGYIGLIAGTIGNLVSGGALSLAGGPAVRWGVFDLPRLRAQVGVADARTEAALVDYHRTVLGALREVEDALVTYGAVRDQVGLQSERAEASREAGRLAQLGFREGVGQFLDVLDAERSRVDAEAALISAQAQHLQSVVAVYRALGGGWELCENEPYDACSRGADAAEARRRHSRQPPASATSVEANPLAAGGNEDSDRVVADVVPGAERVRER